MYFTDLSKNFKLYKTFKGAGIHVDYYNCLGGVSEGKGNFSRHRKLSGVHMFHFAVQQPVTLLIYFSDNLQIYLVVE